MPAPEAFQYAVLRLVPRIERGERLNVGVVLFCRRRRFLAARVALDAARLAALAPECDVAVLAPILENMAAVAAGEATGGPLARLDASERFGWLTAPSSTMIQPSPVHTGLTEDPAADLDRLFARLVET
ncbi:MAG: hypothetical protein QOF12_2766 [Solirubrobacteraceae bacterium]|jgi:hypothetical protein|nr:hypothetical protein [Solirubrobacteraceae bacterium]